MLAAACAASTASSVCRMDGVIITSLTELETGARVLHARNSPVSRTPYPRQALDKVQPSCQLGGMIWRDEWHLDTRHIGRRVFVFDQIDSTNSLAMSLASDAANDGVVVLAREQTAGRGQ